MLLQDPATSQICGAKHEHQFEQYNHEEQWHPEIRRIPTECEHAAEYSTDDSLNQQDAHDSTDDGTGDDRDSGVCQEACRDLARTQTERLLGADLRYLLVHDAADSKVGDEQAHDDEQGRHREAEVRGDVAEHGNLSRPRIVGTRHYSAPALLHGSEALLGLFEFRLVLSHLLLGFGKLRLAIGKLLLAFRDEPIQLVPSCVVLGPTSVELGNRLVVLRFSIGELLAPLCQPHPRLGNRHGLALERHGDFLEVDCYLVCHFKRFVEIGMVDYGNGNPYFISVFFQVVRNIGSISIKVCIVFLLSDLLFSKLGILVFLEIARIG